MENSKYSQRVSSGREGGLLFGAVFIKKKEENPVLLLELKLESFIFFSR